MVVCIRCQAERPPEHMSTVSRGVCRVCIYASVPGGERLAALVNTQATARVYRALAKQAAGREVRHGE